jgi:UDP:flavonoid glycosyltransferase YjiC (YdhE family)
VRILFTCYPGFGHLHPMLPLARAALRAGHEVAFATGPDVVPRAASYGFDAWSVGLSSGETVERYLERHPDSNDLPPEERLRMVAPRMFVDIAARSRVGELRERARRWGPGLIVHDQSEFAAPIVARALGIPAVVHSWGPMMPAELLDLVEPAYESLAAEHGVTGLSGVVDESVYVDICPPGLQLPGGPDWKRIQPVRHEDPQPAPGEELPAAAAGLPHADTVYVTLGTVVNKLPGVFEAVLEALAGMAVNAIVTVGPDVDPGRLGPQPASVLVERYIPQALVHPRCRAIVAHAGAGTMLGALAQGVPQVLLPHGAEQHLNAEACRRAGAALVIGPEEIGAEAIRAALARVLAEPSFAAAALRLRGEIEAMPAADDALAALIGA